MKHVSSMSGDDSTPSGAVRITVAGQTLDLLPQRAVFWREASTLLVADTHFGKAATFRQAGVPVPRGTTTQALTRLGGALDCSGAARLVFLGDFFHAREGRDEETLRRLTEWRSDRPGLDLLLVRGNHDRGAGDPPGELGIRCEDAPVIDGLFALSHHPVAVPGRYVVAGHLHPAARLFGPGLGRARLPCFWFGEAVAVLPAFGDFTGSADITAAPDDHVWVVADGTVLRVRAGGGGPV